MNVTVGFATVLTCCCQVFCLRAGSLCACEISSARHRAASQIWQGMHGRGSLKHPPQSPTAELAAAAVAKLRAAAAAAAAAVENWPAAHACQKGVSAALGDDGVCCSYGTQSQTAVSRCQPAVRRLASCARLAACGLQSQIGLESCLRLCKHALQQL